MGYTGIKQGKSQDIPPLLSAFIGISGSISVASSMGLDPVEHTSLHGLTGKALYGPTYPQ